MPNVRKSAIFIDADYVFKNGQSYIRLLLKGKKPVRLLYRYDPYFYVDCPPEHDADIEKITARKNEETIFPLRAERVMRIVNGSERSVLKLYAKKPTDIPILKGAIPYPCYEYTIPFSRRFILDLRLTPISTIRYERDGRLITKIFPGEKKEQEEPRLKRLAFDIETYNPLGAPRPKTDPVIMISYATEKRKGVITYKKIPQPFVETVADEKEMIERFCEIVQEEDPDIIIGYNSGNFDLPYLQERAKQLKIPLRLGRFHFQKDNNEKDFYKIKKGMISGVRVEGRIHFDIYPAVRFFGFIGLLKTQQFTLESTYEELTGKKKHMVKRLSIWEMWDSGQLEELANYSLHDSEATLDVASFILPLQIELSRITRLSLFDISLSTSGQLVESLLMYEAAGRGMVIPNRPTDAAIEERNRNPIQGGFVKLPAPGIYSNLVVFDFRGLYPSIIISYNIDPLTLLKRGGIEEDCFISPTGARFRKKPQGLIPFVLESLLEKRSAIKNRLKNTPKESEEYATLSARSHALKILSNSFYGYLGYARSRWYSRECAESVTAWGRMHIMDTISKAEKAGFEVVYGDSITADRFITVLDPDGMIKIQNIEELFIRQHKNAQRRGEKEVIKLEGYRALTLDPQTKEAQWKPIDAIIRHKTTKQIFRISQKYGETRVTEDHSIIIEREGRLGIATPEEMIINSFVSVPAIPPIKEVDEIDIYRYLQRFSCKTIHNNLEKIIKTEADASYVWFTEIKRKKLVKIKRFIKADSEEFKSLCRLLGAYISEGRSSTPEMTPSRWGVSIASADVGWLKQLKSDYENLFIDAHANIIASTCRRHMYKLQMMNKLTAIFFKAFCGQKSTEKRLPDFIFHTPQFYKQLFLEQMIKGDGSYSVHERLQCSPVYKVKNFKYRTRSLCLISGLSLLLKQLGFNYFITYRPAKQVYMLEICDKFTTPSKTKIIREEYSGYVYDLAVQDSHMFVDSCGQVLLHNTDSIFLIYKNKDGVLKFLEKINSELPEKMELELESFYTRGVFVSKKSDERGAKKKYALLADDGRIKIRGFELVRRDWSAIAKDAQYRVLEAILKDGSKEKAVEIVRSTIEHLKSGTVPMESLAIHTQITKDPKHYDVISPELSAARKALKRGIPVEKGSVISYIVTKNGKTISEKAELTDFAKDYDVDYYINHQVLPAVMKLLKELGYSKEDLLQGGKQHRLESFF